MDWLKEFEDLIKCIGSATYGKERWFHDYDEKNGRAIWYDRHLCDYISTEELIGRVRLEIMELENG